MNNRGWGLNEMLLYCGLLGIAFIIVIVLVEQNFKSLVTNPTDLGEEQVYTHKQIENNLIVASTKYLENQDIEIQNGSTIKITTKILKENNYIGDLYDTNHELCTGYIIYSKQDDGYSYNPYIKCGNIYQTKGYIN